jgi:hypothetical protein
VLAYHLGHLSHPPIRVKIQYMILCACIYFTYLDSEILMKSRSKLAF